VYTNLIRIVKRYKPQQTIVRRWISSKPLTEPLEPPAPNYTLNDIYKLYKTGERNTMDLVRMRNRNFFRSVVGGVIGAGITGYVFSNNIKEYFSGHTADIATRSITDDEFQNHAQQVSKEIVKQILSDEETYNMTVDLLNKALNDPTVINKTKQLTISVINDPEVQKQLNKVLMDVTYTILDDPIIHIDCNLTLYHAKHGIKCLF
jgi:hypothetical protein